MKKFILLSWITFLAVSLSTAQVHLDLKFGISPGSKPESASILINRNNPHEEFQFNMTRVKQQYYGGFGLHLSLRTPFFVEGGLYYSKKTSDYEVRYKMPKDDRSRIQIMNETEEIIHVPVSLGVSMGSVDVTSGITVYKNLSRVKQLSHINGFQQEGNPWKFGWQMGIRYPIQRILVGMEFQGTLNRVGQGMKVNDDSLELQNVPGKLVFSIQYRI